MSSKNKKGKEKAQLYKTGLRLNTPRPQVFEDKRRKKRSTEKVQLKKHLKASDFGRGL